MPIQRLAAVALAALLLTVPAVAEADRSPTKREQSAVSKALGLPKQCVRVRVSTVDERWARANVRNKRIACAEHVADGVAIFKRSRGAWKFITAGSSFDCPVPDVPRQVARDLKLRCEPR